MLFTVFPAGGFLKKTRLCSGLKKIQKNPRNMKTWVYIHEQHRVERNNESIKPDKYSSLRRPVFYAKKPRVKMLFKNYISGFFPPSSVFYTQQSHRWVMTLASCKYEKYPYIVLNIRRRNLLGQSFIFLQMHIKGILCLSIWKACRVRSYKGFLRDNSGLLEDAEQLLT